MDKGNNDKEAAKISTKKVVKNKGLLKEEAISPKVNVKKYEDIQGKLLHVKVGTREDPATEAQIQDIQSKIVDLLERNKVDCLAFVTHHAVSIDVVKKNM